MSLDTRFSSAIHFLIIVSESQKPLSSSSIARSIGTNASYVRRLASSLKHADLIESRPGIAGFTLNRPADQITFLDIARAAMETDSIHMFDIHQNPNDQCVVGHYIQPVLTDMFAQLDASAQQLLKERTLQDCIDEMREEIDRDGDRHSLEQCPL